MNSQNLYHFIMILKNVTEKTPELEDKLYKAGCDDAIISYRNGDVYLDFDRRGNDFADSILSAIKDVKSSGVNAFIYGVLLNEIARI